MLPKRVHFPWKFVSSELKNSKGEEIFFPINDARSTMGKETQVGDQKAPGPGRRRSGQAAIRLRIRAPSMMVDPGKTTS
jgi:hypothetical protein